VGKELLKRRGAKGGILHQVENLEIDLPRLKKCTLCQATPTQATSKQGMQTNVAKPTDSSTSGSRKSTKKAYGNG